MTNSVFTGHLGLTLSTKRTLIRPLMDQEREVDSLIGEKHLPCYHSFVLV